MKRKFLTLILGTLLTCSLLSGCGNNSDTETTENTEVVEDDTNQADMEETEPVEQTEVVEEDTKTWFESSGLSFTPAGSFSFLTSNYLASDGDVDTDVTLNANVSIETRDNGDNTKTIIATLAITPWADDSRGAWGWSANYGFVDQYTGISIVCSNTESQSYLIEYKNQEYEISVSTENVEDGSATSDVIRTVNLTCPSEYDGTAFFLCGSNTEIDNNIIVDVYDSYENIEHGDYDILLFEGVDTAATEESSTENISDESETETTQESATTPAVEAPAEEPVQQPVEAPAETTPAPVEQPTAPDTSYSGGSGDIFPGTPEWDAIFGGIDDSAMIGQGE